MNDNLIIALFLIIYFSPALYQLIFALKERKKGNLIPFKKLVKILKISLMILLPIVALFIILIYINFLDYEKPIPYSKINSITFKNFRGLEFFKKSLYGNEQFAYITTEIKATINQEDVRIETYFHPSRSFVYNTHSTDKELLTHELYHFKIAELFSRLAKQKISNFDSITIIEVKRIIKEFRHKEDAYQKAYDYDTFHSYVLSEQKKYEKSIDSLLNLLSKFKQPKVKIYVKD